MTNGKPPTPPDESAPRGEKVLVAILFVVAVVATFVVYRPDRKLPFDFVDFSEFLPLLARGDSFTSRMRELLSYYAGDQGRFNPVGYATLAIKWELWRDNAAAWQWIRFATMWLVVLSTFRLLRRMNMTVAASAAGASLFLFSLPAIDGWTRLTMAEPLGTLLLLGGCLLATRQSASEWSRWWTGAVFALLCLVIVLLKEMLAATLLLPIALVALSPGLRHSAKTSRIGTLLVAAAIAVPIAAVPVVATMVTAGGDAYTSAFGSQLRPLGDIAAHWSLGLAPYGLGTSFPPSLAGIALLLCVGLLAGGWTLRWRTESPSSPKHAGRLLLLALAFPLIGAAIYLPWPAYNRFYAIPYLLGGALLAAGAISGLQSRSRALAVAGAASWCVLVAFAAADAARQAGRQAGRQRLNYVVVQRISERVARTDTVFLATDLQAPTFWQGIGPTLQRYGEAVGYPMPRIMNLGCQESLERAAAGQSPVLFYQSLCPRVMRGMALSESYRAWKPPSLHLETDSIRVDLVLPGADSGAARAPGPERG